MNEYIKKCPTCQGEMKYKSQKCYINSINNNNICQKCLVKKYNANQKNKFYKFCPKCNKKINFATKYTLNHSIKNNFNCKSCQMSGLGNPMYGKSGNLNPFFGKHHSEEYKKQQSELRKGKPISEAHRQKIIEYSKTHDNSMKGRSVYSIWLQKYGKEIADKKMAACKEKQSKASSGKNNSMYGKPSPKGSGVGWKGWYKNVYFRSLREVSYLIHLDENNITWVPAEKKQYTIKYINWDGAERTYRPDFIINNEKLVEIKPKRLHETPNIIAKTKAALIWAAENNLKYEIIDFEINYDKILNALNSGLLKFDRDYKERFLKYLNLV